MYPYRWAKVGGDPLLQSPQGERNASDYRDCYEIVPPSYNPRKGCVIHL